MADWSTRAGERTEAEEACGEWRSYRVSGGDERERNDVGGWPRHAAYWGAECGCLSMS